MKILLVEDDLDLAKNLITALVRESFSVEHLVTGNGALENVDVLQPEIIILDLGLPDIDGIDMLAALRKEQSSIPVLVLTARDQTSSLVHALDAGADDYLSKPFDMAELLARLRVLGRRVNQHLTSEIRVGEITLNLTNHNVQYLNQPVNLTRREYMLLKALMENTSRVLTKESLENKLYSWGEEIASNTIEVHISNLRKKLPKGIIQTVRGVGYTVANNTS